MTNARSHQGLKRCFLLCSRGQHLVNGAMAIPGQVRTVADNRKAL